MASEDLGDIDPLTSDNRNFIESDFEPDLNSSTPMVKQMEMHIRAFGMESRLTWNNKEDEYTLQQIVDSPLPPVISMHGSHVKRDGVHETQLI